MFVDFVSSELDTRQCEHVCVHGLVCTYEYLSYFVAIFCVHSERRSFELQTCKSIELDEARKEISVNDIPAEKSNRGCDSAAPRLALIRFVCSIIPRPAQLQFQHRRARFSKWWCKWKRFV